MRYRGYYYDVETGLYYLRSRYYDPVTCRFINQDNLLGANRDTYKYNLFAYCSNNPTNMMDSTGQFAIAIGAFIAGVIAAVGAAALAQSALNSQSQQSSGVNWGNVGKFAFAFVNPGAFIAYRAAEMGSIMWQGSNKKEQEKSSVAYKPSIEDVPIFRYGGISAEKMTPRKGIDESTGLSFSTIPRPGAAMTTIRALNSTGLVYAVKDSPTHVKVRPFGATVEQWIEAGPDSVWTAAVRSVVIKWDGVE